MLHDDLYRQVHNALTGACQSIGAGTDDARLLRLHSNAVFHLPKDGLVARISAGHDVLQRINTSLAVTAWLASQGFPTIVPNRAAVVEIGPFVVSFWQYVEITGADKTAEQLAVILRQLHALSAPPFDLPKMPSALASAAATVHAHPEAFANDDQGWLIARITDLDAQWDSLDFALPCGLIHGDAHPNNLLPTADQGVLIGDWDSTSLGPREWDLIQPHYFHRRFSTTRADLDRAAHVYGWDIRTWAGIDTLVAIREISGLGSYIRTAAAKPSSRAELTYRLSTLRAGDTQAPWNSPQPS